MFSFEFRSVEFFVLRGVETFLDALCSKFSVRFDEGAVFYEFRERGVFCGRVFRVCYCISGMNVCFVFLVVVIYVI